VLAAMRGAGFESGTCHGGIPSFSALRRNKTTPFAKRRFPFKNHNLSDSRCQLFLSKRASKHGQREAAATVKKQIAEYFFHGA
jgi:hypothetical protein